MHLSFSIDGAFAVVDIDTLWTRLGDGKDFHFEGRTCKIFTSRLLMARMENDWTERHTHDHYCTIDVYCVGFEIGLWLLLGDTVLKVRSIIQRKRFELMH